jgi:hypothetical protein
MKYAVIYALAILTLSSCVQSDKKSTNKSVDAQAKTLPLRNKVSDSFKSVPGERLRDTTNKIKILICADWNKGEVNQKDTNLNWKGLFHKGQYSEKDKYYISDTKVKFIKEHSERDADGQSTGWWVKSSNKDYSTILIAGDNNLITGRVKVVLVSTTLDSVGQNCKFDYNSVDYTLYTTGDKKSGHVFNYKLFLKANLHGRQFNQLLTSINPDIPFGTDEMSEKIEIEFAGDLDGDGIPDFIIGEDGYLFGDTKLYLSRYGSDKKIVKLMASIGNTE